MESIELSKEDIVHAVRSNDLTMAWVTSKGAIVYTPPYVVIVPEATALTFHGACMTVD
jgi:hypothetical protein